MCYVLTTRRTTECYSDVFRFIESNIFKLEANEFMTDFEGGLRKSIEEQYPRANLRGCWFHFCEAVRRNAKRFGLSALFKDDIEAKLIFKSLLCIPLLPENLIIDGYNQIKKRAFENNLVRPLQKLFNYFESYWLNTQVNE